MTTPPCATGCGRPSPSAAICGDCQGELRRALQLAAAIAVALEEAVARQASHGPAARGSRERPLPVDLGAMAARDNLRHILYGWVLVIATGDQQAILPPPTVAGMAAWLAARMRHVAVHDAAADVHGEVRYAVAWCARVLEPPPDRVYAGPCPQCGADLLGKPGAVSVDCRCGASHDVAVRQAAMRDQLDDMLGTVSWLVTMTSACGWPVTENTIKSWIRRGQLVSHGSRPGAGGMVALYRLGDALDLAARNPRRAAGLLAMAALHPHTVTSFAAMATGNGGHSHFRGDRGPQERHDDPARLRSPAPATSQATASAVATGRPVRSLRTADALPVDDGQRRPQGQRHRPRPHRRQDGLCGPRAQAVQPPGRPGQDHGDPAGTRHDAGAGDRDPHEAVGSGERDGTGEREGAGEPKAAIQMVTESDHPDHPPGHQ